MFTRILTSALFAGVAAGLLIALMQYIFVQPVLLHAELYEGGALVHFGADPVSAHPDLPGFDAQRDLLSVLFTALIYCGYALAMIALMSIAEERGAKITVTNGMIWGVAGFVAAHLAPAFSLAPEVPGVAAADVAARQMWFFPTIGAAVAAMWLLAFHRSALGVAAAVILLAAPHLIGAPEPDTFAGPVPTEIGALFAVRALGVGLAAWVILGALCAHFWTSEAESS